MRRIVAFYAWQSDTPPKINKDFIRKALNSAAERINADSNLGAELQIDSDTQNVPGTPPVTQTILDKIARCDIFFPDVTFVGRTEDGKLLLNPNVMAEYGFALRAKTVNAMMPIMNTAFGPPMELPFDMGHLRHPIQYRVEPTISDGQRRADRAALSKKIESHLREQIAATQPPPPAPIRFPRAEARDGPARFRLPSQPLGRRWSSDPFRRTPEKDVFLSKGSAIWLRLFPAGGSSRKWSSIELKDGASDLTPFIFHDGPSLIRADDGIGLYSRDPSNQTMTNSAAFAFETGEV